MKSTVEVDFTWFAALVLVICSAMIENGLFKAGGQTRHERPPVVADDGGAP